MPRKDKDPNAIYKKRARELRKLGYNVKYTPSRKAYKTPQYKAAVNRLWDKAKFYVGVKNQEFHRYGKKASRKKWEKSGAISRSQSFPKGFFMEKPPGVTDYKLRLTRKGIVKITSKERGVRDEIIPLDAIGLAEGSKKSLEKTLKGRKRPRKFLLRCNGHSRIADRHSDAGFNDLESFNRYIENDLIPELNAAEFDYEKWGQEVFGVILQYSGKGQKKAEGEGKPFDFSSGGIFDSNSKVVYGRKKFLNRKKHKKKKGKRKGS